MAAEAVGLLVAAVAERRVEAAERHMVVEAAVPTAIAKRSELFRKAKARPSPTRRAFCLLFPEPIPKPVHNSLFFRVFNEELQPGRF
jgi:hypothetical protein